MKCPKCKEEIDENIKFCTKCGANIEEEIAKKEEQIKKKQKAAEDKKKLEEIRKAEEAKREKELKEAEKQEAIRQAKEEGIELEIIDEKEPEIKSELNKDNTKEKQKKEKKVKPTKVKIKKNIFQRIFNKLIFMIIVAAIIIGTVWYCYSQKILPEFIQNQVEDFDKKLQNVIKLNEEVRKNRISTNEETKEEWIINPEIEAEDIKDLTEDVSVIVKNGKQGLIENETGKIVLEPQYTQIYYGEYYDIDKTETEKTKGIIVKDIEKYYKIDSNYKISTEIKPIAKIEEGSYYYDHHDSVVYFCNLEGTCKKAEKTANKNLKICSDIDIVTTEGISAKDTDLPETFSIDYEKSKITTKGYCDTSKAELVINCDYDEEYEFSEGYAAVKTSGKSGIIDENGNKVIDLKYEETRSVHNGQSFAKQNGKWGIIKVK